MVIRPLTPAADAVGAAGRRTCTAASIAVRTGIRTGLAWILFGSRRSTIPPRHPPSHEHVFRIRLVPAPSLQVIGGPAAVGAGTAAIRSAGLPQPRS